jgi:ABC-type antimicrobial peptide transport system permease subunit
MENFIEGGHLRRRYQTNLLALFALLGVLLAVTGVYGVASFTVEQRTREIGLRLALGGRPRDILAMVMKRELRVAGGGVFVGVSGAVALSKFLSSFLFGITALDGLTFITAVLILLSVAAFAIFVPSRRAAAIDPAIALRDE